MWPGNKKRQAAQRSREAQISREAERRGFDKARRAAERQETCEECGREVGNYIGPTGSFAPEMWETLRENGINPSTNHSLRCSKDPRR